MKEQIKEAHQFYDKYAKPYSDYTFPKLMQFQLNEFISLLPKNAKILDVGCGSGRDSQYFYDFNLDVTGIDLSENMLKEAKARAPEVIFKKMDMRSLKFPKESFDGLWFMSSLTTIEKKDALPALKEAAKVLKKKGIIYIAVKEGKGEEIKQKPEYENSPKFYAYYEREELESLLLSAGFTITKSTVEEDSSTGQKWVEVFAKLSS